MFTTKDLPDNLFEDGDKAKYIMKKIKKQYSELNKQAKTATELEIKIGEMLNALKQVVKKDGKKWNSYIEKNFPYMNIRTVQRWMKLAKVIDIDDYPNLALAGQTRLLVLANLAKIEDSDVHTILEEGAIDLDFKTESRKQVGKFRSEIDCLIKEKGKSTTKGAKTDANVIINRLLKAAQDFTKKLDDTVEGEEETEEIDKDALESSIEEVEELLEQLREIKKRLFG